MKWILDFVRRRRIERELAQEVESHLDEKVADLMEAGMPEQEARQKANREFGNVALYREISREVWGWVWLETLLQDLRYGARMLRKNPSSTGAVVIALALGIGLNTTVFTFVNPLLLRPPAGVKAPDRLLEVWIHNPRSSGADNYCIALYLEMTES